MPQNDRPDGDEMVGIDKDLLKGIRPGAPRRASWLEWLNSSEAEGVSHEHKSLGGSGAGCALLRGREAFGHPVTPDVTVEMLYRGDFRFHHADQGHGRWSGVLSPGDFIVTPAHHETVRHGVGRYEALVVALPWERMLAQAGRVDRYPDSLGRLHAGINRDGVSAQLVRSLWEAAATGGAYDALYADSLVYALTARLLVLSEAMPADLPDCDRQEHTLPAVRLRRVVDYIEEHLAEEIMIGTLAQIAGYSPFHFSRLFRAATGKPPHRWVIERRVERAKHLLMTGVSVTQVAFTVGFCDAAHLTRHMKRVLGATPSDFRR